MRWFEEDPRKAEWLVRRLGVGSNIVGPVIYVLVAALFKLDVVPLPSFGFTGQYRFGLLVGFIGVALALAVPIAVLRDRLAARLKKRAGVEVMRAIQRDYLIVFALAETVSLLGLAYYILSGDFIFFLAFPALTLAYYFAVRPDPKSAIFKTR
jgi:hypothetical protein